MRSQLLATVLAVTLVPGCASIGAMQPTKEMRAFDVGEKSLVLFTVVLSHPTKPAWNPGTEDAIVIVEPLAPGKGKKELLFRIEKDSKTIQVKGNKFLCRLVLDPGKYIIRGIRTVNQSFPIVASAFVPMHSAIETTRGSVVYAGRVTGIIGKRTSDDEFRTGSMTPILHQGTAGYALTTIHIDISDAAEVDIPKFQSTYRSLNQTKIETRLLPPFDREAANAYWRNGGEKSPAKSENGTSKKKKKKTPEWSASSRTVVAG